MGFKVFCYKPFLGRNPIWFPVTSSTWIFKLNKIKKELIFQGKGHSASLKLGSFYVSASKKFFFSPNSPWKGNILKITTLKSVTNHRTYNSQAKMLVFIIIQKHRNDDAPPSIHCILHKIKIYCSSASLLHDFNGFLPELGLRV